MDRNDRPESIGIGGRDASEYALTARLDVHETAINEILGQIRRLLSSPPEPERPKKRIGFLVEEAKVPYITKMKRKS